MPLRFVPIPTPNADYEDPLQHLRETQKKWKPFLGKISHRSKESVDIIVDKLRKGLLQLGLIEDEKGDCRAVLGFQYRQEGDDFVGEIVHLTGTGMKEWGHLLDDVHLYLKEKVGCTMVRAAQARRGLEPFLEKHGYKRTHVIMEHRL